jgi:tetratricopeptide (TPR) repeat protein
LRRPGRARAFVVVPILVGLLAGCAGRAARLADDDVQGWLGRGQEAAIDGRHLDSVAAYERVLRVDYANLAAHRGLVQAYFHLGRLGELEARYRERLAAEADNPFHAYGLAITAYATTTARADEALGLLEQAEARRPDLSDLPYRRGVILLDAERFEEAREALEGALAIEDRARYRAPLALALYQAGAAEESLDVLRGLLALEPTPREVELARQVAERISDPFRSFPDAARGRVERAIAWLEHADVPQNAIDLLREVLLEYPEAAMVHSVLGLAYQRVDAGGEAFIHLQRAVELEPDLALPRLYLANFMLGRERYEDARQGYLAALERNPLLIEAHAALGRMASDRGDLAEATRHLRAWTLLAPRQTGPRLELSRMLAISGDLDGAQRVLEEVLDLEEENLEAHLSLGAIYARRRATAGTDAERAAYARAGRRHIEKVLEVQPDNPAARRLAADLR